ncbi:MAG: hypothetical protein COA57_10800 [Flavobacteriales bacterium]|nr:MAG: hypothetical protein COA57_10800 [Flavobacteriales bacterium]
MRFCLLFTLAILITSFGYSQIVINEVSQGPSGSKEYVEILVIGDGTCNSCVDIRGWIFDDNNGWHESPIGVGQGIASGCMQFAYDPFWACVPAGTLILIYNNADLNASLPPDDLSSTDGNCTFVIPSNSTLFNSNTSEPNTSGLIDYSTITFTSGGNWNTTSMANTNDSYQLIDPNNTSAPYFSIGWGNNTLMQNIYFSGSSAGDVMYMTNSVDNDPFNSANWVVGSASTDQTPGAPNNAANAAWISSLNNNCTPPTPPVVAATGSSVLCNGDCNGTATSTVTGGTSPYTYNWSTSATTSSISSLCAGTYQVTVTDADGCTDTLDVGAEAIVSEPTPLLATINKSLSNCTCPCNGLINLFPSGGTPPYSISWSNGYTDQFQNGLCDGTYTTTVTDSNGCTVTASVTIP